MAIKKLVLITSLCGALVAGCVEGRNIGEKELTKVLGGEQVVAILRKPDKATAALLVRPNDYANTTPDQFKLLSGELDIPSEAASRIASAIADPRSNLQLSGAKGCIPRYEVRFSYIAGKHRVDLYLCFGCDLMLVYLNGKEVGGSHFDNVHDALIRDALALFPDNPKLVELANR